MTETVRSFPKSSGIYKITSPTGLVYIGEAKNLHDRCRHYLNPSNIVRQRALFNSLTKHSVDAHAIEIVELCDSAVLYERERHYQEMFDTVKNGLNCKYTSVDEKKTEYAEETLRLMSEKASGSNNAFYGRKHSAESLAKISAASSGKNNSNYGSKFKSPEYLQKQSLSNSKRPILVTDVTTGIQKVYLNSKEAALNLDVKASALRTAKSYGWKLKGRYLIEDTLIESADIV